MYVVHLFQGGNKLQLCMYRFDIIRENKENSQNLIAKASVDLHNNPLRDYSAARFAAERAVFNHTLLSARVIRILAILE